MSSRKHVPPPHEGSHVPNFIRIGQSSREPLEDRLSIQAMDIEQLTEDNHRLSSTRLALSQDFVAVQTKIQNLTDHMRSMKAESDIQIRVMMEKIGKMETDIISSDDIRQEYRRAIDEATSLAFGRKELRNKIQEASEELGKTRADIKKLPEMRAELDCLKKEHESLCMTFESEKKKNVEKVEKMKTMEKEMVGMAEEVERLRAAVHKAEQRAKAPPNMYAAPYSHPNAMYPPYVHGGDMYVDNSYGWMGSGYIPQVPMPYGGVAPTTAPLTNISGTVVGAVTAAGEYPLWLGTYNGA